MRIEIPLFKTIGHRQVTKVFSSFLDRHKQILISKSGANSARLLINQVAFLIDKL